LHKTIAEARSGGVGGFSDQPDQAPAGSQHTKLLLEKRGSRIRRQVLDYVGTKTRIGRAVSKRNSAADVEPCDSRILWLDIEIEPRMMKNRPAPNIDQYRFHWL
jgi:hypothetical protein